MARTTIEEVIKILDNTGLSDAILTAFVDSANVFVTQSLGSTSLSATVLTEIEKWIAAHMVAITRERTAQKEGAGGAEITYTGKWGEQLRATNYGQMAITLDTTGTLDELSNGRRSATIQAITSFED